MSNDTDGIIRLLRDTTPPGDFMAPHDRLLMATTYYQTLPSGEEIVNPLLVEKQHEYDLVEMVADMQKRLAARNTTEQVALRQKLLEKC